MTPGVLVYVYLGTAISDISDVISGNTNGGTIQLILVIVGSVLAFLAIVKVSYHKIEKNMEKLFVCITKKLEFQNKNSEFQLTFRILFFQYIAKKEIQKVFNEVKETEEEKVSLTNELLDQSNKSQPLEINTNENK